MSRRWVGVVLLLVVLVAVSVGARISGQRIAGNGSPAPQLGAAQVGTCIAEISGPGGRSRPTAPVPHAVGESSVRWGDCAQPHIGEVLASRLLIEPFPEGDDDGDWCRAVGTNLAPDSAADSSGSASAPAWRPVLGYRFMAIFSTPERSTEYRWAACAIVAPLGETYDGRYLASGGFGARPAPFGECRRDDVRVSCGQPHDSQDVAHGVLAADGDLRLARDSCADVAARVTGMPDVTAGGRLQVEVVRGDGRVPTDAAGAQRETSVRCRLQTTGGGRLTAALTGIGSNPLPWA